MDFGVEGGGLNFEVEGGNPQSPHSLCTHMVVFNSKNSYNFGKVVFLKNPVLASQRINQGDNQECTSLQLTFLRPD